MKLLKYLFTLLFLMAGIVGLSSCEINSKFEKKVSIIMPTGTPALAMANLAETYDNIEADIVAGSDLLVAAFNQKDKDIIIAPVNLGAKFYQANGEYQLYKTFVWGNLYVASKQEIAKIEDLDGKEVVVFGKNSTPDIVFQSILKKYQDINVTITYASDVSEANTLLASGQAEYVISAEPSLSKLKGKLGLHIIDLQDVWEELTGSTSYPQAGIFVRKGTANDERISRVLKAMVLSVKSTIAEPEVAASRAVSMHKSFETIGAEILEAAIPNCHYAILDSDKEAVLYYLQQMMDLGFTAQMGGKLPDEGFFI